MSYPINPQITAFLCTFLMGTSSLGAGQSALKDYPLRPLTPTSLAEFQSQIAGERDSYLKTLEKKYAAKPEKIAKDGTLQAFDHLLETANGLDPKVANGTPGGGPGLTFFRLQRLHYGILADIGGKPPAGKLFSKLAKGTVVKNLTLGPLLLKIDKTGTDRPVGLKGSAREAENLFTPEGQGPLKPEEIALLTPRQISKLEPAPGNSALSGSPVGSNYDNFTRNMVQLIRQQPKMADFDLTFGRRILFFDEIKTTATSPKIDAKDRFGAKWKMKWGDEVHTDIAMTRLAIDIGAIYTDLKFYSGPNETLLILPPPDDKSAIKTCADLERGLLESPYEFHLGRYLFNEKIQRDRNGQNLGMGTVDKAFAERESIPAKYLGSWFVTFKECQLTLANPALHRLGGAALSHAGAENSRIVRGSLIFNGWIKNKDMKDDNSRVGLLFNPQSGKFDKMVEFQSDLGCTLGGLIPSGELNSFGPSFIQETPFSIHLKLHPLYIPVAWKNCQWSDGRWMARRIAQLKREEIEGVFAESGWPPFAQQIAVEKLLSRRNELVRAFDLGDEGFTEIPCDPKLTMPSEATEEAPPLENGIIEKNSPAVRRLESAQHPEGLATIVPRSKD